MVPKIYTGVSFLSVVWKIYGMILVSRVKEMAIRGVSNKGVQRS